MTAKVASYSHILAIFIIFLLLLLLLPAPQVHQGGRSEADRAVQQECGGPHGVL